MKANRTPDIKATLLFTVIVILIAAKVLVQIRDESRKIQDRTEKLKNQVILHVPEAIQVNIDIESLGSVGKRLSKIILGNEGQYVVKGLEVCALFKRSEICSQFSSIELEDGMWIPESTLQRIRAQMLAASNMQGFSIAHTRYVLQNL